MARKLHIIAWAVAAVLLPDVSAGQAPPNAKPPLAPQEEVRDPKACVEAPATTGKDGGLDLKKPEDRSLSEQLADSQGVICPPPDVDPEMRKPPPGGGAMPVIPPPGSPGGDPSVQPK
jgi:hypothetical protein